MTRSEFTTNIRNPNQVDPVTPIEETLFRWVQLRGSYTGTRINPSQSSRLRRGSAQFTGSTPTVRGIHILTEPSWTPETDTFCQLHADVTGCVVEAHDALLYQVFQPANPPERPTDPPISDKVKATAETAADLAGLTILIAVAWAAFMVL